MKTLVLMRHGLAAHASPDYQRPLEARGREQATLQGVRMKSDVGDIDLAIVSGAVRTAHTLAALRSSGLQVSAVQEMPALYSGSWREVMTELQAIDEKYERVLVIGHEPTMSVLASMLASSESDHAHTMRFGFSTAQYVWGTLESWHTLAPEALTIRGVQHPGI